GGVRRRPAHPAPAGRRRPPHPGSPTSGRPGPPRPRPPPGRPGPARPLPPRAPPVGHALGPPRAGIKAAVSSLRHPDLDLPADATAELIATIEESTDRLDALIDNLLSMSRLQAGALSVD